MIRRLPADKYNIAWFKLAEFVERGEKERALGLYRLLIHSIQDNALAYQLEGDLLFAFSDAKALNSYQKAAQLFQIENRLPQAAAVYEHLYDIKRDDIEFLKKIVELYGLLGNSAKASYFFCKLLKEYIKNGSFAQVDELLNSQIYKFSKKLKASAYKDVVITYLGLAPQDQIWKKQRIDEYLEEALEYYAFAEEGKLQHFLSELSAVSEEHAIKAQIFLEK